MVDRLLVKNTCKEEFSFLGFNQEINLYQGSKNIPKLMQGRKDEEIVCEDQFGVLRNTCNGKGMRSELSKKLVNGYMEYVCLENDTVLGLNKLTPNKTLWRQLAGEPVILLGVRFHNVEELEPLINSSDNHIFFCGVLSKMSKARSIVSPQATYSNVSIMLPLATVTKILDVHVPAINRLIESSFDELDNSDSFFTYFHASSDLLSLASQMIHSTFSGQLRYDYLKASSNVFLSFAENLCSQMEEEKTSSVHRIASNDREALIRVRASITNSVGQDLRVATLAKEVGLSEKKLGTLFKTYFGVFIHDYIIQVRMEKAKLMLENTNLQVREISRMVGYRDVSGFSRSFRKSYGTTPSQIRKI